jgi:glycosyltransferase involved in cell wall biosynthesis
LIIKILKREKIDILIYHFYDELEIKTLNNLKNTKTIYYNHSCALIWIYAQFYYYYRTLYSAYKQSKYVISLVPFENDYLFKKWGINSILMSNFISYEYNSVIPSDLSSKTILMIGRGSDRLKRFELGIESMKYIIKEIQDIKMKIISDFFLIEHLKQLVNKLNLDNCVEFVGYTSVPEIFFNNASLHIFPSICESFGLVLSETKIFGIPNIVVGLDYISIVKGGTIILYDDKSESIAKEAIKILKDDNYRKKLGREARKSMKKFKNELFFYNTKSDSLFNISKLIFESKKKNSGNSIIFQETKVEETSFFINS